MLWNSEIKLLHIDLPALVLQTRDRSALLPDGPHLPTSVLDADQSLLQTQLLWPRCLRLLQEGLWPELRGSRQCLWQQWLCSELCCSGSVWPEVRSGVCSSGSLCSGLCGSGGGLWQQLCSELRCSGSVWSEVRSWLCCSGCVWPGLWQQMCSELCGTVRTESLLCSSGLRPKLCGSGSERLWQQRECVLQQECE